MFWCTNVMTKPELFMVVLALGIYPTSIWASATTSSTKYVTEIVQSFQCFPVFPTWKLALVGVEKKFIQSFSTLQIAWQSSHLQFFFTFPLHSTFLVTKWTLESFVNRITMQRENSLSSAHENLLCCKQATDHHDLRFISFHPLYFSAAT